jgi:hypothetical protein
MIQRASIILMIWMACLLGTHAGWYESETLAQPSKEASMSGSQDDTSLRAKREESARLEQARAAARKFCRHFDFPQKLLDRLVGDPIQKPLIIERNGTRVEVFRWLGHGRGAPYVQVEMGIKTPEIIVYGAFKDHEFGPWKP